MTNGDNAQEVLEESINERRECDAETETRHLALRFRWAGSQPQAGNRDRPQRGAQERREGSAKAIAFVQDAQVALLFHAQVAISIRE
jgi:hypothetical protein